MTNPIRPNSSLEGQMQVPGEREDTASTPLTIPAARLTTLVAPVIQLSSSYQRVVSRRKFSDEERGFLKTVWPERPQGNYPFIVTNESRLPSKLSQFLSSETFLVDRQPECCSEMSEEEFLSHVGTPQHLTKLSAKIREEFTSEEQSIGSRHYPLRREEVVFCVYCAQDFSGSSVHLHEGGTLHRRRWENLGSFDPAAVPPF